MMRFDTIVSFHVITWRNMLQIGQMAWWQKWRSNSLDRVSELAVKNYSFRQALKIFSTQLIWIIIQTLTDKATWGCLSSWLHQSMAIFLTASRGATDNFRQVRPHYHCGLVACSLRILFRQIKVRPSSCRFYLRRRPWPLLPTASNRIEYNTLNST